MTDEHDDPLATHRDIAASRSRVWEVLADGWTYSQWVVGNSRMRDVDPTWPAAGSKIHHSIGVWPVVINDVTISEECVPEHRLVLLAKSGPLGAARITLTLRDIEGGCQVAMSEVPVSGPAAWVPDKLALLAIKPRNKECLWRLALLAQGRERTTGGSG
jgi:uncharacterized protein YndB with AHSA1/START domain